MLKKKKMIVFKFELPYSVIQGHNILATHYPTTVELVLLIPKKGVRNTQLLFCKWDVSL